MTRAENQEERTNPENEKARSHHNSKAKLARPENPTTTTSRDYDYPRSHCTWATRRGLRARGPGRELERGGGPSGRGARLESGSFPDGFFSTRTVLLGHILWYSKLTFFGSHLVRISTLVRFRCAPTSFFERSLGAPSTFQARSRP